MLEEWRTVNLVGGQFRQFISLFSKPLFNKSIPFPRPADKYNPSFERAFRALTNHTF